LYFLLELKGRSHGPVNIDFIPFNIWLLSMSKDLKLAIFINIDKELQGILTVGKLFQYVKCW